MYYQEEGLYNVSEQSEAILLEGRSSVGIK